MGPLWRPPFEYQDVERIGIKVGDSSVRALVRSGAARAWRTRLRNDIVRWGASDHKEIWTYSVPGAVAVHSLTGDKKVSTFKHFWDDHAHCRSRFHVYFVPAKDSLGGNWGSGARARAIDSLLWPLISTGRATKLSTVQNVFERLNIPLNHVFGDKDPLHMSPAATKRITRAYFEEIRADQHKKGTTASHVPILVWDFNAGAKGVKADWQTHQSFWTHLVEWAEAEGDEKRNARNVLSRALETALFPDHSYYGWRSKPQPPDEVPDTSDTELDIPWCPGLLASRAPLHGVIVGSRVAARRAADEGNWPSNILDKFWRPAILGRLRATEVRGVTQEAVDLLCDAVKGDYQALYHAVGSTEPPQRWYKMEIRGRTPELSEVADEGSDIHP